MNPRLQFWLRVAANLMLAFGALVAYVNPPQVFFPVSMGLVTLMVCAGILWVVTMHGFFGGLARVLELGGLAGVAVLLLFVATRSQAMKDRWSIAAALGHAPEIGLSSMIPYFSPKYGPQLVRSEHAMEARCGYKLTGVSTIAGRGDYALCYASLRLRGKSDEQILAGQNGAAIFLGTLAAESFEPYWWNSADWLKRDLPLHPAAGWKMGLMPPAWASASFQQLITRTPADPELLEGMVFLALQRFHFATAEQRESLLTALAAQRKKDGFPIDASLEFRARVRQALAKHAKGEPLNLHFQYPGTWSADAQAEYTQVLQMYLRAAGLDVHTSNDGLPVAVSASYREWDPVTYSFRDDVRRDVVEQRPGSPIHVGSTTVWTLPSTTHREVVDRVSKRERGKLGVPTAVVSIGGEALMLPPSSLVSRELAYSLGDCDPLHAKPGSEREIYESLLAQTTLDPWLMGMYWPSAVDDLLKRDEEFIPRSK